MDDTPQKVRFPVAEVVHPRPTQILMELFRHLNLKGEVVATTTNGDTPYLVVRVAGLSEAVIVPTEKACPCEGAGVEVEVAVTAGV